MSELSGFASVMLLSIYSIMRYDFKLILVITMVICLVFTLIIYFLLIGFALPNNADEYHSDIHFVNFPEISVLRVNPPTRPLLWGISPHAEYVQIGEYFSHLNVFFSFLSYLK